MSTRRLLIVTSYPFPGEPVVRNRIMAYVNVLSDRGWKITVVAPVSSTNEAQFSGPRIPNCEIVYVPVEDYNRKNFVVRALNEIRHSWRLLRRAAELQPDVVLVTIPSIFLVLSSIRRFSRLHVVDVRDLVWEYLPKHPWWKGIPRSLLKASVFFALRRADMIALSNPHEFEYVQQRLASKLLFLVSNGIGRDQFDRIRKLRHQRSADGALRITHIGNVGIAQNLTTLVQAVAGIRQLHVNIVGGGTDLDRVRVAVQQHGASNVHLHGLLPWEKAIAWYEKSDVLYAQLSPAFATAMPSKLYEYLATGLPVVYGGTGAAVETLKSFSGVTVIEPNAPEKLRATLLDMLESRPELFVNNIERISRQYIREDQVKVIESYFETQ